MSFPKPPYLALDRPVVPPPSIEMGAVCVQFDSKWLPYILTLLKTLCIERTWTSDQERAAAQAQGLLSTFILADPCVPPNLGGGCGDDCMGCCIRIENGVLQTLDCGVWTDVPGGNIAQLVQSTPPFPTTVPTPEPGGCEDFWMQINGIQPVLLPVTVNEGDSILIDNWSGAWSDGAGAPSFSQWFCADGGTYLLGACTGITSTSGADPLPSANHMSVVAMVEGASSFLAPMGSARYVPPGVSDGAVYLQANDNALSDNLGGVSVHVVVCRGAAAPIGISYAFGNGPASANVGDVITVTSENNAGANQHIQMTFSDCVTITVENVVGWVTNGSTGSPAYDDCASVTHNHSGADVIPSDWLINVDAFTLYMNGDVSAIYQAQIRIIALA